MDSAALALKTPTPSPTTQRYTFTPKLNSKTPRAWERKPSTPFAPRNDSQRIWKRHEFRDTNLTGSLQSKTVETRPLKKLRLGGQETHSHITCWDDELHETRHKDTAQPEQRTITQQISADSNITYRNAINARLALTNDGYIPSVGTSQNVENQEADNTKRPNERMRSISTEIQEAKPQDPHPPKPECRPTQAPIPIEPASGEKLDLAKEQGLTGQKQHEQVAEHGIVGTPQGLSLPVDDGATDVSNDGKSKKAGELPNISVVEGDRSGEKHGLPEQTTDEQEARHSNTTFDEASQAKVEGCQPQATDTSHKTPPLRARAALGTIARHAPNEVSESKVSADFTLEAKDTERQPHPAALPQLGIKPSAATHEDPLRLLHVDGDVPDSIEERQLLGHGIESTGDGKKDNARPESLARPNPLLQVQEPPSRASAIVPDEDTDYLHAFLTRAKAKKAAREGSPQKVDQILPSPMTRSRAALLPLCANSPSPKKASKNREDTAYEADVAETSKAGSPCRRSGRIRLPPPVKAPTVTTSTIPVRRSNGTEFIFLQNTDIAQIALATRTNTKRNKGEAVMPKMKLQALAQTQKSPSKSPKPRKGKEVSWKDQPTYFGTQDDEPGEARPERKAGTKLRARKVRRPGAANGTPAPKKTMADDAGDMSSPMPRKRRKARSVTETFP